MNRLIKKLFLLAVLLMPALAYGQNIQVNGTVRDEDDEPMAGVFVIDKNNPTVGTSTDTRGKYSIAVASDGFLEFSFLGFQTVMHPVGGKKKIDVTMRTEASVLEETVVIGYGTAKKTDLTGSVSVVDMRSVEDNPATTLEELLQGRIAGADFLSGTGEAGESGSIQLRGSRSISAGNAPLIVVDGVPDAVTDLSEINPSDVASISVLKDVSSTAIYGSRGANGVILITTKTGREGVKITTRFKGSIGVSSIAGKLDLMDASEYAEWRNMIRAASSSSENIPVSENSGWPVINPASYGKGTDWIDVLTRTGMYQDYNLSVTGGSKVTTAAVSVGFNDTKGITIGSGYKRYAGRMSFDTKVNQYLKIGIGASYTYQDVDRTNAKVSGTDGSAAIFLSPLLGKEDTWNKYGDNSGEGGDIFNNPYICAKSITSVGNKANLHIAPRATLTFAKYWTLKSQFSFTRKNNRSFYYEPSYLPLAVANKTGGKASRTGWLQESLLSETTLMYKRSIKRVHDFDVMVGFTGGREKTESETMSGTGYLNDHVTYNDMAGLTDARNLTVSSYQNFKTSMSVLSRVNYSYRKRYLFTFTARVDGASNFAKNHKWGFFPAAAMRWNISNEKFMKKVRWINELALRLSAGRSGNDAISSYMSLPTLLASRGNWVFGDQRLLAYTPNRIANSNLTWETSDSYDIGLNFSAFKKRIELEVDAYHTVTSDLLLAMKQAQTTGYSTYYTNMGKTSNTGFEFSLTTRNIVRSKFTWTSALTLSHNAQRVIDAGNNGEIVTTYVNPRNNTQPMYGYRNGYPVNALWGYQFAGVWHNEEEIDRNNITHVYASMITSGSNGTNVGRSRYMDVNHDGLLDQNDMVYLGNSDPVVFGGFQNTFTIMNRLTIGVYFTYSIGGKIYNLAEMWLGSGITSRNKYRYMLDTWDAVRNPDSDIPTPNYDDALACSRFVHDASYLRLKTVNISYNFKLPDKWSHIKAIKVGVSGDNLWLLKKYNGFDPDVSTSTTVRRLDNGSIPRARSFVFNLQLTF